jgi:hypothetical protein
MTLKIKTLALVSVFPAPAPVSPPSALSTQNPRIFVIENFLSDYEADQVRSARAHSTRHTGARRAPRRSSPRRWPPAS